VIRCLNNQLVKKRQGNEAGNTMLFEYNIELNDQPLVEIGEVSHCTSIIRNLFRMYFRWLLIVGQRSL
jgi:hypothetical protein